jgi:hypothetical protein
VKLIYLEKKGRFRSFPLLFNIISNLLVYLSITL